MCVLNSSRVWFIHTRGNNFPKPSQWRVQDCKGGGGPHSKITTLTNFGNLGLNLHGKERGERRSL